MKHLPVPPSFLAFGYLTGDPNLFLRRKCYILQSPSTLELAVLIISSPPRDLLLLTQLLTLLIVLLLVLTPVLTPVLLPVLLVLSPFLTIILPLCCLPFLSQHN